MPTGYTADVVDGKVTEFKDFALQCARAFGALITLRDEPADAPIPEEIKPATYYDDALARDMRRLQEVQAMTNAECEAAARAEYDEAVRSRREYIERMEAEAARLNAMLAKVRAWNPPTQDHEEMKRFMIEQLTISMPGEYVPSPALFLDGPTWRQQTIDRLAESVVRYKEEVRKEHERAAGRTEWLRQLRRSLAA